MRTRPGLHIAKIVRVITIQLMPAVIPLSIEAHKMKFITCH